MNRLGAIPIKEAEDELVEAYAELAGAEVDYFAATTEEGKRRFHELLAGSKRRLRHARESLRESHREERAYQREVRAVERERFKGGA